MSDSKSKAELLRRIKSGSGIQYILDEVYKILGNPLVIHDMEYKLVAHSDGIPEDDPFCKEFLTDGRLSHELISFCMDESFIDSVSNTAEHDGITILISDSLKYDRIFGQLYNKNKMPVADLIMLNSGCPFDDGTPELVKKVCGLLSRELGKDAYYQEYGQVYQESILKALIEGSIEERALYTAHVANIDAGLKSVIFAAVAHAPAYAGDHAELVKLRELLREAKPIYKYYIYKDYVVILLSSDVRTFNTKRLFGRLLDIFEREGVYCGVSRDFDNLFEMSARFNEAEAALSLGDRSGEKRVFMYSIVAGGYKK